MDLGYTQKSKNEINDWIKKKKGTNRIYSINIAKFASSCPRGHLIIVTNGEVSENDKFINDNNIQFKFVSVYVIGTGGNLSVGILLYL